jgi:hypothetical protein
MLISALNSSPMPGSTANAFQMDGWELDEDVPLILAGKNKKKEKQEQPKRSSGSGGGQSQPRQSQPRQSPQQSPQRLFQGGGQGSSGGSLKRSESEQRGGGGSASPSGQRSGSKDIQRSGGQGATQRENSNRSSQSSPKNPSSPKRSYPLSSPYKKDTPKRSESKPDIGNRKPTNQNDEVKRNDIKLRTSPGTQDGKKTVKNQNIYNKEKNIKQNVNVKNKTNVYVRNKNVVNVKRRVGPVAIRRGSWCRRGWVAARPWRYGWYGGWRPAAVVYPGWGWWAATAPAWGALTLSPTIVIQQSVDSAVASNSRYIDVPNSEFRIYHASISPIGPEEIEFDFEIDGDSYRAKADCKSGLLNDETPAALEEAELMHTACTIAFSSLNDDQAGAPSIPSTAMSLLRPFD